MIAIFLISASLFCFASAMKWALEGTVTAPNTFGSLDIHGQGDSTVVAGSPSSNKAYLYNLNIYPNSAQPNVFTNRQTLARDTSQYSGFGVVTSLEGNDVTGDMLLVGSNSITSTRKYSGSVYYYNGRNSKWSTQQVFSVPQDGVGSDRYAKEWSFYGDTVDIDGKTDQRFVIGCPNCSAINQDHGTVFVYSAEDERSKRFVKEEALITANNRLYGLGHTEIGIHGDTIVAMASRDRDTAIGFSGSVVFHRSPATGKWTETQTLMADGSTTNIAVYDDTIFLATAKMKLSGYAGLGAVYVYNPNTPVYSKKILDAGDKPAPLQWSFSQMLLPTSTLAANLNFGWSVDVSGNNAVVMEAGTGSVYIYERERISGMWSEQRKIIGAVTATQAVTAAVEGSHVVVTDGITMKSYAGNMKLNCFVISVEDHFGDGWGNSSLVVVSPDHSKEKFAPDCDTENPLQFRYCPFQNSDRGKYIFSMPDASKNPFFWEILWRVFDEASGKWYTGNWDTTIEAFWDESRGGFYNPRVMRGLDNNITCKECPPKPTNPPTSAPTKHRPKSTDDSTLAPTPSPGNLRKLKGSGTLHPTISPAPTLLQDPARLWYLVYMTDDSNRAWFDSEHRGTNYYISDKHGKKLLKTGTVCPWNVVGTNSHNCYQDLKDGEYIFRVGGALDRFKSTRNWWFCGRTNNGGAQTQFKFRVSDEGQTCTILSHYTAKTYCKHVSDYDVVLRFTIGLGTSIDATMPAGAFMNDDDRYTIQSAFKQTFGSLNVDSVTIVTAGTSDLVVDVGFKPSRDVFQSEETFDDVVEELTSAVVNIYSQQHSLFSHYFSSSQRLTSPLHYITQTWLQSIEFEDISDVASAPSSHDSNNGGGQGDSGSSSNNGGASNNNDDGVSSINTGDNSEKISRGEGGQSGLTMMITVGTVGGVVILAAAFLLHRHHRHVSQYESLPMDTSIGTNAEAELESGTSGKHIKSSGKSDSRKGRRSSKLKGRSEGDDVMDKSDKEDPPREKHRKSKRSNSKRSSKSFSNEAASDTDQSDASTRSSSGKKSGKRKKSTSMKDTTHQSSAKNSGRSEISSSLRNDSVLSSSDDGSDCD